MPPAAASTGTESCTAAARVVSRRASAAYQATYPKPEATTPEAAARSAPRHETCATRRVLRNLGGSWSREIWDTEVGVGQFDPGPDPHEQACAAAFLLRLHTKPSARIKRVYITRLKGGPGTLFDGKTPRDAMNVLARRQTQLAGCK